MAGSAVEIPAYDLRYWTGAAQTAAWLITGGLAAYLLGSRVVFTDQWLRLDTLLRVAVAAVTGCLAQLEPLISSAGVVLVTAVWAAVIAAWVTWRLPGRLQGITADRSATSAGPGTAAGPRPGSPGSRQSCVLPVR